MIATGSEPAIPPIPGLEGSGFWTNIEATETTEVPQALVVLGGGPVGCELAQFFARLGSGVTLVQSDDRLLPRIDAEAAALVEDGLREDGVDLRLGATVTAVDGSAVVLADGTQVPVRPAARGDRPPPQPRRPRRARPDHQPRRNRRQRAAAGRPKRLGNRRRHGHRPVHARREVPRANRRLRHGRARDTRRPPRDPGHDLHRPAGRDRRDARGRQGIDLATDLDRRAPPRTSAPSARASSRSPPIPSGASS